jgi:N-acetylglucosamine-6-phosphate deacetylase
MTKFSAICGQIVTPHGIVSGELKFAKNISSIKKKKVSGRYFILPGHIDLHVHGGGGFDFMQAGNAIEEIAATHSQFGTTALLATTVTATPLELLQSFQAAQAYWKRPRTANLLGIHLEGPFINEQKLGAQPADVRPIDFAEISKLHKLVPIKILTLAPEKLPSLDDLKKLKKMNIIVQIGHSNATYEQACEAFKAGCQSVTHLFNAMSPFHHRAPGVPGAALAHATYSELIPDLLHVHAGAIKAALRAIPKLYFVTDATAATGMPDGDYRLGTHEVSKCQGGVRLPDGTLAGSCLTMNGAVKNALTLGMSMPEVAQRTAQFPAELIKLKNRGMIKIGAVADFVVVDGKGNLQQVYCQGKEIL